MVPLYGFLVVVVVVLLLLLTMIEGVLALPAGCHHSRRGGRLLPQGVEPQDWGVHAPLPRRGPLTFPCIRCVCVCVGEPAYEQR
jgi:hypothetical protein